MNEMELHDKHGPLLTRRQRQVLRLQAYGLTHREIGENLGLSIWTVKNHHKQAIRTLASSLHSLPRKRVRTALACYILGLIDAGWSPTQVARHLNDVSPPYETGASIRMNDQQENLGGEELAPAAT